MPRRAELALLALLGTGLSVQAGPHCNVPLAEWQPREALQARLQSQGWTVLAIRTDDGCYKVQASRDNGERLKALYDPKTLEPAAENGDGEEDDADE